MYGVAPLSHTICRCELYIICEGPRGGGGGLTSDLKKEIADRNLCATREDVGHRDVPYIKYFEARCIHEPIII